jgi:hypothetical protein
MTFVSSCLPWPPPALCRAVQANEAVDQAFEELVLKILDTPSLLAGTTSTFGLKRNQPQQQQQGSMCCG